MEKCVRGLAAAAAGIVFVCSLSLTGCKKEEPKTKIVVESEGQKYLLLGGRDPPSRLARLTVSIGGRSYDLENHTHRDHFLLWTEIDSRAEGRWVDRDKVRFYSADGEDLTELYDLSGGGI